MALLNHTTKVEAARTVSEIQSILAAHGARAILLEYDAQGQITALSFKVEVFRARLVPFRLPVSPDAVLRVMERQRPRSYRHLTPAQMAERRHQAIRVAWRIIKDWVEAQMALLETEQVKMEQIFLPYLLVNEKGQTLFDRMASTQFQLGPGKG